MSRRKDFFDDDEDIEKKKFLAELKGEYFEDPRIPKEKPKRKRKPPPEPRQPRYESETRTVTTTRNREPKAFPDLDFGFYMPPNFAIIVVANGILLTILLGLNLIIEGRSDEIFTALFGLAFIPAVLIWSYIHWIYAYLVSRFYWWINGASCLMVTLFLSVAIIAALVYILNSGGAVVR